MICCIFIWACLNAINPFTAIYKCAQYAGGKYGYFDVIMVLHNFIQNHNHCRNLHQIFFCLFETFASEIIFLVITCLKNIFSTAENTRMSTFVFNIIVLEWLENYGSKM